VIGIVVVSHSERLAEAAVELALEMVQGDKPPIAIAAGAGEGIIGTDATKVAAAIEKVGSPEGVLVIMDLGSALMSAEMALEFLPDASLPVKLTSAPFVEGLLAAIVRASGGATLEEVEREARGALAAKSGQLGDEPDAATAGQEPAPSAEGLSVELELINPTGLHTRPAAMVVAAIAGLDAKVTVANLRTSSAPVRADSPIALLTLGTRTGDRIRVAATGADAQAAITAITALVTDGFGEL
jgi:dihydroxyacetone kinase phosphotransfer subunit